MHSHVHLFSVAPLLVARLASIPIRVAHSHTTSDGQRKFYRLYMRLGILHTATHLLGCSAAACESLFGSSPSAGASARVFPNAIDFESYESRRLGKLAARARLGLPANVLIVGHVGRFDAAKNHAGLVAVLAGLFAAKPSCQALLVGDGPLRKTIEDDCRRRQIASRVQFLGLRRDVPEILSALDCFVFPSLYEGLGLAVIEAQAVGVPCVVSEAVPLEADLGLGLIQRSRLNEPARAWASRILDATAQSQPDLARRKQAFTLSGYDIAASISQWEHLYLCGATGAVRRSARSRSVGLGIGE